ncbi:MAG: hypothetical protein NVSMB70_15090 [Chamaesiphon sp.]
MPLYPFLALAVGVQLDQIWHSRTPYPRIWLGILTILAVSGLGGCVYFVWANPQPVLILMSVIMTLTMGTAAWRVKEHNRQFIPVLFLGMYLVLGLLMSSHSWIWELKEAFPVKPVAAWIREYVSPGTTIYTSFADSRPSLDFYSDCKVIPAPAPVLQQLWSTKSYVLLDKLTLKEIQLPDSQVLGTAEGFTLIAAKNVVTDS